jgi:gamma-glutamyltranspeptidase/glutathione hydrolase
MTTSNGEGSGYVVPGTGVMLNNMLGEDDLHPTGFHTAPAGERVPSMMSPTIVLDADGEPCLALGSGGSKRIRTAILQVLSGVLDHGLTPRAAVDAARIHWDGAQLQVEPGLAPAAASALEARWLTNPWPDRNLYFGGVHTVAPASGTGAGDPRRGGVVATAQ